MAVTRRIWKIPGLDAFKAKQGLTISLELFDADGCLYHVNYIHALRAFIAENWMFFYSYRNKPIEEAFRTEKLAELKNKIRKEEYNNKDRVAVAAKLIRDAKLFANWIRQERSKVDGKLELDTIVVINEDISNRDTVTLVNELLLFIIETIYQMDSEIMGELVVVCNKTLFDFIISRQDAYELLLLAIGSQRQSQSANLLSLRHNKTGCIFHDIIFIESYLQKMLPHKNVVVIRMVLADIENELEIGESFSRVLRDLFANKITHGEHEYDETKLSILYPILHCVSDSFRKAIIRAHFYDDRDDIHRELCEVFSRFEAIIAKNVFLKLMNYQGGLEFRSEMRGIGQADCYFTENTKLLIKLYRERLEKYKKQIAPLSENEKNALLEKADVATLVDMREFLTKRATNLIKLLEHAQIFSKQEIIENEKKKNMRHKRNKSY